MRIALLVLVACSAPPKPTAAAPPAAAANAKLSAKSKLAKVDFDADGLADLAFSAVEEPGDRCTTDGKRCWRVPGKPRAVVLVFLGRDGGAISQTIELATSPDNALLMPHSHEVGAVGDLDGDGHTDVAVQFDAPRESEKLLLLRGTRKGLSEPYQTITMPKQHFFWYGLPPRPAGDLDGDGRTDIVVGPAILRGAGNGKLHDPTLVANPGSEFAVLVPVGDVTGDGSADLVIRADPRAWLLPSGGLARPLALPRIFDASDLDGDGKSELVGAGGNPVIVTTYKLSATGAKEIAAVGIGDTDDAHHIAFADVDGSGVRDIGVVVSNGVTDVPCALKCEGPANVHVRIVRDGVLAARHPPAPEISFGSKVIELRALGDIDGDGIDELAETSNGVWTATKSKGGQLVISPKLASSPSEYEIKTHYAHFDPGR